MLNFSNMGDFTKRKSASFCRGLNKLRTVNATKWELPIPGSKPYWDKICDDLERRKEHVSDSSNPPFPCLDEITGDESASIKSIKSIVEPIVKIFPPTPSRIFATRDNFMITENFSERENKNQVSISIPSSISFGNLETDDTNKETKISGIRKEFLSHDNVRTKKSCRLHKNAPALKIFDDNLKRFLPKNRVGKKLANSNKLPSSVPYENFSELSKLHRKKFCPLLGQAAFETRRNFGSGMIKGREEFLQSFERCETANSHNKRVKSNFYEPFTTTEPLHVSVRSKSERYRILNKKSKSEILKSNLDDMLAIPILENIRIDENLSGFENGVSESVDVEEEPETRRGEFDKKKSDGENSLQENFSKSFETLNKKLPSLSDNLSRNLVSQKNFDAQKIDRNKTAVAKLPVKMKKEFLKVPKLGMISSYSSFSKLTPRESVEAEDNKKSFNIEGSTEISASKNLKIPEQQVEPCKRDFLKVPKLGMMSSYASFNSLIPESLDSDDGAASSSGLTARQSVDDEPRSISIPKSSKPAVQDALNSSENFGDEKSVDFDESAEIPETCNEEIGPRIKSNRRHSLKDSVRYAYRALKFMTRNKNLDFKPQKYQRYKKSESSSRSSGSSRTSRYSKFEPPIKVLTYEDISKSRAAERSVSSSSYGTVKSRLKQSASQYLGSDYIFVSSKAKSATGSTTIPSLTRSTSGPTLDFQEPIYERPSEEVLSRLPKMSIFPRRKYDKCLACLYKAFEVPVQPKRELPLTLWNAVTKEQDLSLSESESSSVSLPDVKDYFPDSESKRDENWLEALENVKKSSLLKNTEWKSSRGSPRMNFDPHRPKQALDRPSEGSPPLKSDTKSENLRRNMSRKDSNALNSFPKPLSLSSEHSKPSSLSGHSTESEEPQIQTTKPKPSSECFASPYAPLHWAPSLDPLKSLKLRKPVSMHGRAASITKTEDESASDDDTNDYRSTRKESKRKVADKNEGLLKPGTKLGDKSNLIKQPSVVAKIITSQLSAVATLTKKQSKVDLFSNNSKTESQTTAENLPGGGSLKTLEKRKKSSDESPESFEVREPEGQTTGDSVSRSSLPQIPEQPLENGSESIAGDEKSMKEVSRSEGRESIEEEAESCRLKEHERDSETDTGEIYSEDNVLRILENYLDENRTPFELLQALGTETTNNYPFNCEKTMTNREIARSVGVAKNLIRLLIESRKYLNPETFSPNLEFSSPQTPLCNPRQLRRVLPAQTYNLVARILGMPENPAATKTIRHKSALKIRQEVRDPFKLRQSRHRALSDDSDDMIVHPPSERGNKKAFVNEDEFEYPQLSPYALFMDKPRRKAINWRPLTEQDMLGYDPEATLNMRATRVTNKICQEFCEWLRSLGGGHGEDIDEEVLKDMFQIEFTAEACRAMQVLVREIPMVPIAVALARNTPGVGELALTRRHLVRDAKAESMPKKVIGFGAMLPWFQRFVPPKNHVNEKWLQCENVPQDLETMEAVWKGITHLDSVKGFLTWVKARPGIKPPKILTEAYAKKGALDRQPSAEDASGHIELEMDQIKSLKVGDVE